MCNLSKNVLEEGKEIGLAEGSNIRLLASVKALMETTKKSFSVVAEMLMLTAEDITFCKKN